MMGVDSASTTIVVVTKASRLAAGCAGWLRVTVHPPIRNARAPAVRKRHRVALEEIARHRLLAGRKPVEQGRRDPRRTPPESARMGFTLPVFVVPAGHAGLPFNCGIPCQSAISARCVARTWRTPCPVT